MHWIYKDPKYKAKIREHEGQRIERGFSTWDWWNFNTHLAEQIVAGLKMFRSPEASGRPGYMTEEEWYADLDFMIKWFGRFVKDDFYVSGDKEKTAKNMENWQKAKEMFIRHFDTLWD